MKKILLIMMFLIVICSMNKKDNEIIIPHDSIRLRIISNSDNQLDIKNKMELKGYIEKNIFDLIKDVKSKDEVNNIIVNNLDNIDKNINLFLNSNDYKISYGRNYFPKKIYKGVIYDEGYYDSLVITLGSGEGSNWWCSLFPPLCLIDENTSDVEYQFYISRIIQNFK